MKKKIEAFHFSYKISYIKIIAVLILLIGFWNVYKSLPKNFDKIWKSRSVASSQISFLSDTTYVNKEGERISNQNIFNEVIDMVRGAHSYILVDMFLWNDFLGKDTKAYRNLSSELAKELILKKKENPKMIIQVISDPINTSYYGNTSDIFESMKKEGIDVTLTDLPSLRDSNPIFSSFWRLFVFPVDFLHLYFLNTNYTFRLFPNLINSGGEKVTLRSLLSLLNFKANHRKIIVTDVSDFNGVSFVSLITSANPHDGSSAHSNVALKIKGDLSEDIIQSEKSVVQLSSDNFLMPEKFNKSKPSKEDIFVSLITDGAIRDTVISRIQKTNKGDQINLLMFYFSDSLIMKELLNASFRGVEIRIILDPNKDAFGREKNGIPNREMADSLVEKSKNRIQVRWCDTHGEQCHGKMLVIVAKNEYSLFLGSANYTRRNIGGYNLETNVLVSGLYPYTAWTDAANYFESLWYNEHFIFSTEYETYKDQSRFKKIIAWIMEHFGLGTF